VRGSAALIPSRAADDPPSTPARLAALQAAVSHAAVSGRPMTAEDVLGVAETSELWLARR
jgi:hypothetical protein